MIGTTLALEFRRGRMLLFWLVVVAVAYGGFVAAFFPTMRSNVAQMEEILKIYPQAFKVAFGMEGSLADPGTFFTTYVGSLLWPVLAAVAGIILATRPTGTDVDRGWVDLPLSSPLSRQGYLGSAIVVQVVALAAVAVTMILGFLAVGSLVGAGFDWGRFSLVTVPAFAFGAAIAGVTTLLAVITLSRRIAGGLAAGILIAMYLLNVIAGLQPDLASLARLSIFHYFAAKPIIDQGVFPAGDVLLLGGIGLAAWLISLWAFRRRDLAA